MMNRENQKYYLVLLLLVPIVAQAADVWENLQTVIPDLARLIVAISYVAGIFFIVFSVIRLKIYGQMTVFMMSQASIGPTFAYMIVGIMLLFFPTMLDIMNVTLFGYKYDSSELLMYFQDTPVRWSHIIDPLTALIQLFGFIAFLRGMIMLSKMGGQGSPPGTAGKAVTDIIGGILAINIVGTVSLIQDTLFS